MEKTRLEVLVVGKVQGVFFRAFTARVARLLGISGWVRNEEDGSVKIVAEGEKNSLLSFLEKVRKGPPLAKVKSVDIRWCDFAGEFTDFEVRS